MEDFMEFEHVPPWAVGTTNGEPCTGAQLPTRDGRRTGNAHIIQCKDAPWDSELPLYVFLTDAGNVFTCTLAELVELFHPPQYISNVDEVIRKFGPPEGIDAE